MPIRKVSKALKARMKKARGSNKTMKPMLPNKIWFTSSSSSCSQLQWDNRAQTYFILHYGHICTHTTLTFCLPLPHHPHPHLHMQVIPILTGTSWALSTPSQHSTIVFPPTLTPIATGKIDPTNPRRENKDVTGRWGRRKKDLLSR